MRLTRRLVSLPLGQTGIHGFSMRIYAIQRHGDRRWCLQAVRGIPVHATDTQQTARQARTLE